MSPGVLPEELITEVLSILPVKSILRFKCVCKPWELLISDPFFVQKHLHLSQKRNRNLALILCKPHLKTVWFYNNRFCYYYDRDCCVVPLSLNTLLLNPSMTITILPQHKLRYKGCFRVIGSINGLLCLFNSRTSGAHVSEWARRHTCFRLWNPATKKISQKLGSITHPYCHAYYDGGKDQYNYLRFAFGCDNSTDAYKVVAFCPNEVRIFSFRDNVWKNIQCFPVVPYYHVVMVRNKEHRVNEGVYLNGTVNWLAIPNSKYFWEVIEDYKPAIDQFVIISLDLRTETYNQFLLPRDLVEVPPVFPTISVLRDCICFSYHIKTTHFAIWMMMEFGVQESWTQFLNICYADIQMDFESPRYGYNHILHPLCLSEDDDTIILASSDEEQAFLYNWRYDRVEKTRITNDVLWMFSLHYIESLVSTT